VRQTAGADAVVIFVHGVFGDAATTWQNSATGATWPDLLAKDADLKFSDIYVVNYASPIVQGSSNIEELAERVVQQLRDQKMFEY
jgi:hypothetical protein